MIFGILLLLFCLSRGNLQRFDLSLNSTACFISGCNGTFTVLPVLNVSVGGFLLTLGEVMPVTGVAGEYRWLLFQSLIFPSS